MGAAFWRQTRSLERIQKTISDVQAAKAVAPLPVRQPSATAAAPAVPSLPFASRYERALQAARTGDLRQARALFEKLSAEAESKTPLSANVHFWLGRCLYELGETDQALVQFHIVLDRFPESAKRGDALLDAGRCYLKLREFEKARHMWQALIDGDFDPKLQEAARKRQKKW
jgi:TolA-binding protein